MIWNVSIGSDDNFFLTNYGTIKLPCKKMSLKLNSFLCSITNSTFCNDRMHTEAIRHPRKEIIALCKLLSLLSIPPSLDFFFTLINSNSHKQRHWCLALAKWLANVFVTCLFFLPSLDIEQKKSHTRPHSVKVSFQLNSTKLYLPLFLWL